MKFFDFFKNKNKQQFQQNGVKEKATVLPTKQAKTPPTLTLKTFSDEPVEIYFHTQKEHAESTLNDLLPILHKIDTIVQPNPKTEFEIACINIYPDIVKITYFGITANTDFDVEIYKEGEH